MLYIVNKAEANSSVDINTEVFGYGSGSWAQGKNAEDASCALLLDHSRSMPGSATGWRAHTDMAEVRPPPPSV